MTFDYTQGAPLIGSLPDIKLRGPRGPVNGVLPFLQRLNWTDVDKMLDLISDPARRQVVVGQALYWEAFEAIGHPDDWSRRVWPISQKAPFPKQAPAQRWLTGTPTRADYEDLLQRLEGAQFLVSLEVQRQMLEEAVASLAERAQGHADMDSDLRQILGKAHVRYVFDESGRLRLIFHGFVSPYDRALFEAMTAYTNGRPGLVRCDVCQRWFVPTRAGRPARRCPGFECGEIAERRYQQSPVRRERRRLDMRVSRARRKGDTEAIAAAEAALAAFDRMRMEEGQ